MINTIGPVAGKQIFFLKGSFRYCKYANFLVAPVRQSQVRRIFLLICLKTALKLVFKKIKAFYHLKVRKSQEVWVREVQHLRKVRKYYLTLKFSYLRFAELTHIC
jgi:hypothetical protein